MGQLVSLFRPPGDNEAPDGATAEQQSQQKQTTRTSAPQASTVKPAECEKPLSTDEALDSLSAGFENTAASRKEKNKPAVEEVGAIDVPSAGFSNISSPVSGSQAVTQKKADHKEKPAVGTASQSPAPPADKKAKVDTDPSMSEDALSALEDLLPSAEPVPEPPKVQPKDIVKEDPLKSEKGVRVGERDDSIPPEYRLTEDKLKKYPAPEVEPSMDSGEALDILSGDFVSAVSAPEPPKKSKEDACHVHSGDFVAPTQASSVHTLLVPSAQVPQQMSSASADKAAGLTPPSGKAASASPAAVVKGKQESPKPQDTAKEKSKNVPVTTTKAESAKPTVTPALAGSVGAAEIKGKPKEVKQPESSKKPLSTDEALDSLSAGFENTAASRKEKNKPAVEEVGAIDVPSAGFSNISSPVSGSQAVTQKKADHKEKPAVGTASQSPAPPADKKAKVDTDPSMSEDALSALEDLLPSAEPVPEPPKVQPKDIVKEDPLKSEKGVRVGERDDSIPPEYRLTEDKLKKYPAPEVEPSMDSGEALDILSGDFVSPAPAPEPPKKAPQAAVTVHAAPGSKAASAAAIAKVTSTATPAHAPQSSEKVEPQTPSKSTHEVPGSVMDALSSSLLPDAPVFKPRAAPTSETTQPSSDKSTSKSKTLASRDTDDLSAQLQSDVKSSSPAKKAA